MGEAKGRSPWGGAWRGGGAGGVKAGGGTVGAQPGEVLEPWGGVWRGGGDLGAESGGGVAGRSLGMRGSMGRSLRLEASREGCCGAELRCGGGASGGGQDWRK